MIFSTCVNGYNDWIKYKTHIKRDHQRENQKQLLNCIHIFDNRMRAVKHTVQLFDIS